MNLLQRHVFTRVFLGTIIALASAVSVFATTQVLNHVDVLITSGEATLKSLELAAVAMPALIEILLPLAFLLGAVRVFATMNGDSEIAALEAGGAGPWLCAAPIYILSALFAFAILPLSLFVEPLANQAGEGIIESANVSEFLAVTAQPGTFGSLSDGLFIRIEDRLPDGRYSGLIFVDMRNPEAEKIFYAKSASVAHTKGSDFLYLRDGVIQTGGAAGGNLVSVRFDSYAVDLSELSPKPDPQTPQLKERSTASLLYPRLGDPVLTLRPGLLKAELHRRFSDWLYAFAFGSIALFFTASAKVRRNGRFGDVAAGIVLALIVRGCGFVALSNSGNSVMSAVLVYAVPLSTFAIFALLSLTRGGPKARPLRRDANNLRPTPSGTRRALGTAADAGGQRSL